MRTSSLEALRLLKTDFKDLKKERSKDAELHAAEVKGQCYDSLFA